jgi:hypothetical protein
MGEHTAIFRGVVTRPTHGYYSFADLSLVMLYHLMKQMF